MIAGISQESAPAPVSVAAADEELPAPAEPAAEPEEGQEVPVEEPGPVEELEPVGPVLPASKPTVVSIPKIGVSSKLVDLGITKTGVLEVPQDYDLAGWYTGSPTPGEVGPSVIAGHVDSKAGPAVFYRLSELVPGDEVNVQREDGSTAVFRIDRVEQYPKDEFPTIEVYQNIDHAGLRLITCGGVFDNSTGHYRDNIVVYATAATS